MLVINKIDSDNNIIFEIENRNDGSAVQYNYKNVGLFLKPSGDYGDIGLERNVSASQDYYNILDRKELKIIGLQVDTSREGIDVIDLPEDGLEFKFNRGDRYNTKISLLKPTIVNNSSTLNVGDKIVVTLNYTGTVNKRVSVEVEPSSRVENDA